MYSSIFNDCYFYYRDSIRNYNNCVKHVSPKEYGIMLQGKRKKKKKR